MTRVCLNVRSFVSAWLLLFAFTVTTPNAAQPAALSGEDQRALQVLASAVAGQPDRTDQILLDMGFPREEARARWTGFDQWPSLRKIETGYFSAIEASGAQGGADYLRTMSRIAAADHSRAIRFEKALASYFPEAPSASITIADRQATRFRLPSSLPTAAPPPEIRAVVAVLEKHVGRMPGGLQGLVSRCCNHSPDAVYDIIRNSASAGDALSRALQSGRIPPELLARLKRLAILSVEGSHALASEPALASLIEPPLVRAAPPNSTAVEGKQHSAASELARQAMVASDINQATVDWALGSNGIDDPPAPAGSGPALGGAPDGTPGGAAGDNAKRYSNIGKTVASGGSRPNFRDARIAARGFGGVLFGNQLDISQMPRPRLLSWVADPQIEVDGTAWGRFEVVLENGDVAPTRRFRQEDVAVANAVVADINVAASEAVGLSGLHTVRGQTALFVVHPKLFGTSLADASIVADARKFMTDQALFERRLRKAQIPEEQIALAMDWRKVVAGYYKITDAPLSVILIDGRVTVERTRNSQAVSDQLRRNALLAFQACDDDPSKKPEDRSCDLPEDRTTFYPALPALMAAFPEFDRLNRFSEAFALMRWAKLTQATVEVPAPTPAQSQRLLVYRSDDGDIELVDAQADIANQFHDCVREPDLAAIQHGYTPREGADTTALCNLIVAREMVEMTDLDFDEKKRTQSELEQQLSRYIAPSEPFED
ncbi:hypothetical protein [Sphingobium sp. TCM1]|uniref:hypothetical protein n=1 Tax=Sphingobium sp. TCM1 TaxID=453246 RepID=UPI0007F36DD3|nr:hypothetical protein [Sphingobium sp. TCM1]OAN54361.1 hypothetical protein A7Q26_23875 [Sphingobium sp. TCM1]